MQDRGCMNDEEFVESCIMNHGSCIRTGMLENCYSREKRKSQTESARGTYCSNRVTKAPMNLMFRT